MNVAEKKERFGQMGEELVADYFRSKKRNVEMSDNKYDMVKDMTVDGKTVEVKTENPFYMQRAITISKDASNQLPKCLKVDRLIYVIVPLEKDSIYSNRILQDDLWRWDGIEIREAPPVGERKYFYSDTSTGKRVCFPIEDSKLLKCITDEKTLKLFQKYSTSNFGKFK
jgi:hypothetical protein